MGDDGKVSDLRLTGRKKTSVEDESVGRGLVPAVWSPFSGGGGKPPPYAGKDQMKEKSFLSYLTVYLSFRPAMMPLTRSPVLWTTWSRDWYRTG